MRIAVYSGSFNPLHIGHQAIMEYLTRDAAFDWVYLVVSPQSPFKDASNVLSGRDRYEAAIEAVRRHPELRVRVDDIELGMEPPHYTVRTLDALREREPDHSFTLVIGADNLESFPRWRDYGRILREYGVVVFPRKGFHRGHLKARLMRECPDYRIELLKAPRVDISSSEIREGLEKGRDMSSFLM
ncbi:MAG: nicotinate (nicotinamide) nucleotide adenylyltransferase [Bacteroidales bacterium]|nr:nicotinate (nicotinamide) nucleotide adenylyltransferase [Bacteroidales bacterium]